MIDALHDPGTAVGAARATGAGSEPVNVLRTPSGGQMRIGIASWTDPSMTAAGVFYPDRITTPEARLRYYSSRFPLVEVDSTYYAIPARRMAELWVDRTPDDFIFNVKAHALMTGQPSEASRLPRELRNALPASLARKHRIYSTELPEPLRDEVWRSFLQALEPLREAGKLGAILMQYPKWVVPSRETAAIIEDAARRLDGWPTAVEFRHKLWLEDRLRERTLGLLRRNGLAYVAVDSPPGFDSSVPAVAEATSNTLAIVRFHGRNTDTWEARVQQVSQRFRYLYDEQQLRAWLPTIRAISEQTEAVHLVFNNCYGNYATTNAMEMTKLVLEAGIAN